MKRRHSRVIACTSAHLTFAGRRPFGDDVAAVRRTWNLVSWTLAATSLALLAGCPPKQDVQCVESSNCDLATGGQCVSTTSGNQWCAYPDPNCPSGYRYSDLDVGDGLSGACVQASTDAGIDAAKLIDATPGSARFDVAYVDEW